MRPKVTRHSPFWVYVVQCRDGTYYTGYTNDLESRLRLHNKSHGAKYLRGRGPVRLVYAKIYRYHKNAVRAEAYLKRQTREYKKELIKIYESRSIV